MHSVTFSAASLKGTPPEAVARGGVNLEGLFELAQNRCSGLVNITTIESVL